VSGARAVALAALALVWGSAAGAQQRGTPQRCLIRLEYADRGYTLSAENYFAGGNVRLRCEGSSMSIRSDSLASYASQIIEFIGAVRYQDSTMTMDADRGTYRRAGERWEARGNVVTRNTSGTTLRGPSLDYLRVVPGLRDTAEVFASGRPTIDYVPRDSTGAAQEPYVIVGDRVRLKGDDRVWAGGRVTVDRSDLAASSDSMRLDTGERQDGELVGNALIRGLGKDSFSLAGTRIELRLASSELDYVQADGSADATSAEWVLKADTIGLDINDRILERTMAWGGSTRPHAVSERYEILADSVAFDSPGKVLTEARAFGTAWVASGVDTAGAGRDWLRGDTVVAAFAKADSAAGGKTVVRRIESRHAASSYYQVVNAGRPGQPSLNYARGDRIVVLMRADSTGGVDRVDIQGQVDGVQLEPTVRKPTAAADSVAKPAPAGVPDSAAKPDTTGVSRP